MEVTKRVRKYTHRLQHHINYGIEKSGFGEKKHTKTRKSRLSIKWFDSVLRFKQQFRVLCRPKRHEQPNVWTNERIKQAQTTRERETRRTHEIMYVYVIILWWYKLCMMCVCTCQTARVCIFLKPQSQLLASIHWYHTYVRNTRICYLYWTDRPTITAMQENFNIHASVAWVCGTMFDDHKKKQRNKKRAT